MCEFAFKNPAVDLRCKDLNLALDTSWDPTRGFPNLKIDRHYYFGGMRKKLKIPIS